MRITLISGSFPPDRCGVGDYTQRLAMAMALIPGYRVDVLTSLSHADLPPQDGVRVRRLMPGWRLRNARTFYKGLKESRPDLVHVQYPTQGYGKGWLPFVVPLIAKFLGARVVQTWHEPVRWTQTIGMLTRVLSRGAIVVVRPAYPTLLDAINRWFLEAKTFHFIAGASALPVVALEDGERLALRDAFKHGQQRLVVFFGFIYPSKGVHHLFDVANSETDHIVIAGEFGPDAAYQQHIIALACGHWAGKVTFTGFLSSTDASRLLSVADVVVLPFLDGGGNWNSSIHGAVANGAYVVTTTSGPPGHDHDRNIVFVSLGDIVGMREAVASCSCRRQRPSDVASEWKRIADAHDAVYRECP